MRKPARPGKLIADVAVLIEYPPSTPLDRAWLRPCTFRLLDICLEQLKASKGLSDLACR
jgi:hypothetical protein